MNEVRNVQNPCLGAVLIWHFMNDYLEESKRSVPFLLVFLVLPIIFHRELRRVIKGTQTGSGFPKVVEKLATSKKLDLLDSINSRSIELRSLTLEAIRMLLCLRMATIAVSTAEFVPSAESPISVKGEELEEMIAVAKKLGRWMAKRSLYDVGLLMRVRF